VSIPGRVFGRTFPAVPQYEIQIRLELTSLFWLIRDIVSWSARTRVGTFGDMSGVFLYLLSPPFSALFRPPTMTDPSTGRAIARALRASLRLVNTSSELLTLSQLYAVKSDLHETLGIVKGHIRAAESGMKIR